VNVKKSKKNKNIELCNSIELGDLSRIQPHGVWLELNSEMRIIKYSENAPAFLETSLEDLLNYIILYFLKPVCAEDNISHWLTTPFSQFKPAIWSASQKQIPILVFIHQEQETISLEIERNIEPNIQYSTSYFNEFVMASMKKTLQCNTIDELAMTACEQIKKLTDYHRVIIYKFDIIDYTGTVIGEAFDEEMTSYTGLRFPSTDIPASVRELYIKLPMRYIPTILEKPVKIVSKDNHETNKIANLSHANLRMVAPVHEQYMSNMGISSSSSIAILQRDKLWGLIACHHRVPKYLSQTHRYILDLFSNIVSAQVLAIESIQNFHDEQQIGTIYTELTKLFRQSESLSEVLAKYHKKLMRLVSSTGMTVYLQNIIKAAENHPDCPLIQVYAAMFNLYAQEDTAREAAIPYLNQAERHLAKASLREQLMYNAVSSWQRNDFRNAVTCLTAVVQLYPRDALAVKAAEWLFYCLGQAYSGSEFLNLCDKAAKHNQDNPYFMASHSFAFELTGDYKKAMLKAEQAMAMESILPWAHHTLAHCFMMTGEMDSGIEFLKPLKSTWQYVFPLLTGHDIWHLALFYLANRQRAEVLELYNEIYALAPETVGGQLDIISLLWRMDMAGMPQDALLSNIRGQLKQHPYEYYTGFNSAHFIYCLARDGDKQRVDDVLKQMTLYCRQLPEGGQKRYWQQLCLPFCRGVAAFAKKDYKSSMNYLKPIIDQCYRLGGSDAQDEIFLQMYFLCLMAEKQFHEAKAFFRQYLNHYQNTALADYWYNDAP
jgi:tetratricopeptide (TPR) repeat protein